MYPFLLSFLFLFILSCDPSNSEIKVNDYPPQLLTEFDLSQVNYKEKDTIPFIHSSGLEFFLTVDTVFTERSTHMRTSVTMPNEEVEVQYTYLSSAYPYLEIKIRLVPALSKIHLSTISINNDHSYYFFNDNLWHPGLLHDTVTVSLGTKTYNNAYSYPKPAKWDNSSSSIRIKSLLYSPVDGILQIGKNNGETFTINR